jgi:hypothetical protein
MGKERNHPTLTFHIAGEKNCIVSGSKKNIAAKGALDGGPGVLSDHEARKGIAAAGIAGGQLSFQPQRRAVGPEASIDRETAERGEPDFLGARGAKRRILDGNLPKENK